jgi:hypothetical protein
MASERMALAGDANMRDCAARRKNVGEAPVEIMRKKKVSFAEKLEAKISEAGSLNLK